MNDRRKFFIFMFVTLISLTAIGSVSYLILNYLDNVNTIIVRIINAKKFQETYNEHARKAVSNSQVNYWN